MADISCFHFAELLTANKVLPPNCQGFVVVTALCCSD